MPTSSGAWLLMLLVLSVSFVLVFADGNVVAGPDHPSLPSSAFVTASNCSTLSVAHGVLLPVHRDSDAGLSQFNLKCRAGFRPAGGKTDVFCRESVEAGGEDNHGFGEFARCVRSSSKKRRKRKGESGKFAEITRRRGRDDASAGKRQEGAESIRPRKVRKSRQKKLAHLEGRKGKKRRMKGEMRVKTKSLATRLARPMKEAGRMLNDEAYRVGEEAGDYDYEGDYDEADYEYEGEDRDYGEGYDDDDYDEEVDEYEGDGNDADDYGDYYDYDYEEEEEDERGAAVGEEGSDYDLDDEYNEVQIDPVHYVPPQEHTTIASTSSTRTPPFLPEDDTEDDIDIDDEGLGEYPEGSGDDHREEIETRPNTEITTTPPTSTSSTTAPTARPTAKSATAGTPTFSDDEDLYSAGYGSGDGEGSGDESEEEVGSGDDGAVHSSPSEEVDLDTPEIHREVSMLEQQELRHSFYYRHGADILRLDTSCVIRFVEAPELQNAEIRQASCLHGVKNA